MGIREEHLSHMEEFERNQKWFIKNFKRILREYREKFVAVWNQRVIGEDQTKECLKKAKRFITKMFEWVV
jgi:hypothetical protein